MSFMVSLSISDRGILKSPTMIVASSVFFFFFPEDIPVFPSYSLVLCYLVFSVLGFTLWLWEGVV